jgi:hypothetical protein
LEAARPVHVKTLRSQKLRMLLTHRKLLQSKAIAIDNDLRATLRNFGLKVGVVGTVKFEARIKELVENLPDLAVPRPPIIPVTSPMSAAAAAAAGTVTGRDIASPDAGAFRLIDLVFVVAGPSLAIDVFSQRSTKKIVDAPRQARA